MEKFDFALLKLRKETQELLSSYLGLDGEALSIEELSIKYGISKSSLRLRIKNNVKSVKKVLENYWKYASRKNGKTNNPKRRGLFSKYKSLVEKYGLKNIEKAMLLLSLKDQDILKMCLGINCTPVSNDEIAKKYDLSTGHVSNRIKILLSKIENIILNPQSIKKNKYEELVGKYGEVAVKDALYSLNKEYVDTIELVFGLNGTPLSQIEVSNKLNVAKNTVSLRVKKGLEKIVEFIEKPSIKVSNDSKIKGKKHGKVKENKYTQLVEKYGEEKVKEALSKIKNKHQNILIDYYGIEGQELTAREIQEKYGIGSSSIQFAIKSSIKKIVELIENPNVEIVKQEVERNSRKKNKYQELEAKYGEEIVKTALSNIKDKYQKVLIDYYGVDGEELTSKVIQEKYDIGASSVSLYVKLGIRDIVRFIEKPIIKKSRKAAKKVNFYQNLVDKYGEDKVRENLFHIDEESREIIKLYYGIDCNEMLAKDIAEKYGVVPNCISLRVKRQLVKLENIILNGPKAKKIEHKKRIKQNKYQELVDKYGKDKVEEALSKLKETYQIVIREYYGVNQEEIGQSEIHEKHDIPLSTIGYLINKGIKNIENLIINPQEYENSTRGGKSSIARENKYEKLVETYGKDKVEETLLRLPEKVQTVIKAYYGVGNARLGASEIHKQYDIALSTIHYMLKKGIKDIELMIENPDFGKSKKEKESKTIKEKDTRYKDLVEKYGKDSVERSLLMLDERVQLVFNDYFINNISQKKIAEKLSISTSNISYIITKSIKRIENFMLDPNNENKKEEFYSKFEGYSKEDVDYALSKIGETYRFIIESTYGLKGTVLSNSEISIKSDVQEGSISHFRHQGIKKIKEKLSNMEKEKLEDSRKGANFKALIEKYGEDLVKLATNKLIVSDRGFLGMYYTFANNKKYTISELSQKIGLEEKELADHELMIIGRLEKLLEILFKEEYLKKMREEFAFQTKSNQFYIKQALQTLRKDDLKLLGLYYGLNGKDILTIEELSSKLGLEEEKIKNRIEILMRKIKHYIPLGKK